MKSMKLALLATLGTFAAAATAATTPKPHVWRRTTTNVRLCNDFHYGNHCGTFPVQTDSHACRTLDDAFSGYVSSVELYNKAVKCTLWSTKNCSGSSVTLEYPGSKDLTLTKPPFDNKAKSLSCAPK